MRNLFLLAALSAALVACARTGVRQSATEAASFMESVRDFERAQARFINGDPSAWKERSAHAEDATVFGAFGGSEKGWKEVGPRYDWASGQFQNSGATQTIEYLNTGVSGDLAFTVAIERQVARIGTQGASTPRALRVTQIFRRDGGAWKLLHRHADPLAERLPPTQRR